jgi:hypothetical protein
MIPEETRFVKMFHLSWLCGARQGSYSTEGW